jgi:hypothetical protein
MTYAADTTVSVEKSKMQIDSLLASQGAQSRGIVVDDAAGTAMIGFVLKGLKYRLTVPLPKMQTPTDPPRGWWNWDASRRLDWTRKNWEQQCRSQWRGMLLLLKAKFLAIEMGTASAEHEFMADLVLESGQTIEQELGARIAAALANGRAPTLMLPQ